jgi:ubiquinone/menaquinone biosynthesis C-methylase UbiE
LLNPPHTHFQFQNGVYVSPIAATKFSDFEKNYLAVREKEKRVLSIEAIRDLPHVPKGSVDESLWQTRRQNIQRFMSYLSKKKHSQSILDIGCGNGFFTNLMQTQGHEVMGLDVNLVELQQAVDAFGADHINWLYADVLNDPMPESKFELITFCCSFQYFEHTQELLKHCKTFLKPGGEIHIIDSPFYSQSEQAAAKARSVDYFKRMGAEEMQQYYHHHSMDLFKEFELKFMYRPNRFRTLIFKDSPFPWLMLK